MTRLHIIPKASPPEGEHDEATEADELATLQRALIQHKQALEAVKWAEDELQPLRRRYADARGEKMLPTLERLRRELL